MINEIVTLFKVMKVWKKVLELFASSIIFWETSYGPGNKSTSTKMLDTCHIKKM